jgi:hypothetical protein
MEKKTTKRDWNMIPKLGTHVISNHRAKFVKGKIVQFRKFHEWGELHIVIQWEGIGPVQYTKTMLDENLLIGKIEIDKQHYRNIKLEELGI